MQTLNETPGFRLIDVDDTALNTPEESWGTPAQFTYVAGRRILRGQDRTSVDFSVFKQFTSGKKVHLLRRAEFCSLVNHPQFDLPGQTIGSPSAAVITAAVGTPRDIQFSLRLLFRSMSFGLQESQKTLGL